LMLNESLPSDPLAFQVLSYDNPMIKYIFLATSMDQKRHWMRELKRMMLDHYTVQIPEKTKMLMLNMDDGCGSSMSSFTQQGPAANSKASKKMPKYLEKRRKSTDANQAPRRPHVRKRSCSGSRNLLKSVGRMS
uniref:PH domain-containing protein n=1 Tax=Gongylonema pulchrum TaxID=637853 RepID=A0A183CV34_9BILA